MKSNPISDSLFMENTIILSSYYKGLPFTGLVNNPYILHIDITFS